MKILKIAITYLFCIGLNFPVFTQTAGNLSFTCTTIAPIGNWGYKHVTAIWIQNDQNPSLFIKTNAKYGNDVDHLTSWSGISGKNLIDAVTGATLSSYGILSIEWDGTDISHNVVMDGNYTIYIEMGWGKDKINNHAVKSFTFTKGPAAQQLNPEGNSNYYNISLVWQPATTILNSIEDKNGIIIFPNPTNGTIKLNFQKQILNAELKIIDLSGKTIYKERFHQPAPGIKDLNITKIPDGMYLITISSKNIFFTYKLLIK